MLTEEQRLRHRLADKKYRDKNKEKRIQATREWRKNNIDRIKEYNKEYNKECKPEWRQNNIDKIKEYRQKKFKDENGNYY